MTVSLFYLYISTAKASRRVQLYHFFSLFIISHFNHVSNDNEKLSKQKARSTSFTKKFPLPLVRF